MLAAAPHLGPDALRREGTQGLGVGLELGQDYFITLGYPADVAVIQVGALDCDPEIPEVYFSAGSSERTTSARTRNIVRLYVGRASASQLSRPVRCAPRTQPPNETAVVMRCLQTL